MKCVAKGVYPINTGKVSIGCMYTPKKPHYTTSAELYWQGVILRKQPRVFYKPRHAPLFTTSVTSFAARFANCVRAIKFWRG